MDEKVLLYASWSGRWKYQQDERFAALSEKTDRSYMRFVVSKKFIVHESGRLRVIESRSDAIFLDD